MNERLIKLLEDLLDLPHGKDGHHYHHSLNDSQHEEVAALLSELKQLRVPVYHEEGK